MNSRSLSWLALPLLLLLTGCPEGGGGDGGFGNGATGIAYVVNTGPNEISTYTIDVVGTLRSAGTVALADVPSSIAVSSDSAIAFVATNNGIHAYMVNATTGTLAAVSSSPFSPGIAYSALAVSQNRQFLYATNSVGNTVTAFTIGANGALTLVPSVLPANPNPASVGASPREVSVSSDNKFLYVANGGAATVTAFTIGANGALTLVPSVLPANPNPASVGSNPRGLAVAASPTSQFLYVANGGDDTVTAFKIEANGALTLVSAVPPANLNPASVGDNPSALVASPNGSFLYVSNQGAGNVSAFTIDGTTGALTVVGSAPFTAGTSPSGVTIEPGGRFLYVSNSGGSGNVSGYRITEGTGELVSLGTAFPAGTTPVGIATPGRP